MRLWHVDLICHLPKQWLMGQHRECCALRGKGWGRKHSTVDYVFEHPYSMLVHYHFKVISVLIQQHKVNIDNRWLYGNYRGKRIGYEHSPFTAVKLLGTKDYPEHDENYKQECLENLKAKGINLAL